MSKTGMGQKLRYRFDNFMTRGGSSIFISLVIAFLSLLIVISIIRGIFLFAMPEATLERGHGFWNNVYITFLQMTDPGNMNQDVNSVGWFKIGWSPQMQTASARSEVRSSTRIFPTQKS